MMNSTPVFEATAPAKVILFGEHAINRGQPAIAAAVGLLTRCTLRVGGDRMVFRSGSHTEEAPREAVLALGRAMARHHAENELDCIRDSAGSDYFAPQKHVLASMFGDSLPEGLFIEWTSDVPGSSGLGSGGSAFTALVAAASGLKNPEPSLEDRARWAHQGDIVAHGGVASALDTQTSLLGGVILYTGQGLASRIRCAPGLSIVVAHTGITAATREVNTRVRLWLAESSASRIHCFNAIGALTRAAVPALARGDWDEAGRLMTLNQLVLDRIGVGCKAADHLIDVALSAGACGAKVSGSGGGGIIIAMAPPGAAHSIADALAQAGSRVLLRDIGVPGVQSRQVNPDHAMPPGMKLQDQPP